MGAAGGRRSTRRSTESGARRQPERRHEHRHNSARGGASDELPPGIDWLPSGALRVRVFAGRDRVTGKRLDLTETIPAGTPNQRDVAVAARERLLDDVEARRHPQTNATVVVLLERYLSKWAGSESFLITLEGYVRNHIAPLRIGSTKARGVDADLLESFYAELARCRAHCTGNSFVEHRTSRPHRCDQRCHQHRCRGLAASTIRHIHHLLSGAYKKAKKWKWVSVNPVEDADPPPAPPGNPQPPKAREAATILNVAWRDDEDWGTQLWLDMTVGERRGEMCALRISDFEFPLREDGELEGGQAVLEINRSIKRTKTGWVEGPTKTHQHRRVVLDPDSTVLAWEYWRRRTAQAALAGFELATDAFFFSPAADHSTFYKPDSITQRYARLVKRLGIATTLHKLRHYSATELILAGVDIRTVAGRLGHGGGGTTTLKVYAAFVSEADQRAADSLQTRMPARPVLPSPAERATTQPRGPYETIAVALRQQLIAGEFAEGDRVPPIKQLAATHDVSVGTAHRAVELLRTWNLVSEGGRGRPSLFLAPPADVQSDNVDDGVRDEVRDAPLLLGAPEPLATSDRAEELDLEIVHRGQPSTTFRTIADPTDTGQMLQLLSDSVRRSGGDLASIGEYEMVVRYAGERGTITTFVAPPTTRSSHSNASSDASPAVSLAPAS